MAGKPSAQASHATRAGETETRQSLHSDIRENPVDGVAFVDHD